MKKPTKRPTKSASQASGTDAVALLKADHRKVEGLFKKAEKASGSAKEALVAQICNELIIHTTIEEEIFYPACRSQDVEEDKMDEAQVEHDGAKVLINELLDAGADSDMYDAKVKVLSEYIKHHVKEEEKPRTGVFAEAKRKGADMDALGQQMAARKEELQHQAEGDGLPLPQPKSFANGKAAPARPARSAKSEDSDAGVGAKLRTFAHAAKRATFGE